MKFHIDRGIFFTILSFIVVILVGLFFIMSYEPAHFDEVYSKCKKDIDIMKNISDDYRLGWNDCLSHLMTLWKSGTNMTQRL